MCELKWLALSPCDIINFGGISDIGFPGAPAFLTNLDSILLQNRVLARRKLSHKGSEFDLVLSLLIRPAFLYMGRNYRPTVLSFVTLRGAIFPILRFVCDWYDVHLGHFSLIIGYLVEFQRSLLVALVLSHTLSRAFFQNTGSVDSNFP